MTLGSQTSFAERISRSAGANTISTTSDATKQYINEGVREFATKVHGIATSSFLTLAPQIDIDTSFAARYRITGGNSALTSTDVVLVSSTLNNATPTTVAAHVASNLNAALAGVGASACITMAWSASTWTYSLCAPGATQIVIDSPDDIRWADGTDLVFGGQITKASATLTSGIPQDCTVETSLPTGFLEMDFVYYNTQRIYAAPFDVFLRPKAWGTPQYYGVKNKKIRLYPSPDNQDYFKIEYSCLPADLGVDGSSDSVSCPLPEETHMAPVYYAAACLLEESHEFDKASYFQGKFFRMANDYKMREHNNNTTLLPAQNPYVLPKVVI